VPKGLGAIRVISGDNELEALEFMTHYRLGMVFLMNPDWAIEGRYHRPSWPLLMLVDGEGNIVFKKTTLIDRDEKEITTQVEKMLSESDGVKPTMVDGVPYMPATLERSEETEKVKLRERFPSLVCGPDGKVYVVFTTNRNGNRDIYLRVFDGTKWLEEKKIAATDADEYDGQVMVDNEGKIWFSWTSNADGKNYNIFVATIDDLSVQVEGAQVTRARDDAMHGRLACDGQGNIWLAYYEWRKMGGNSRDKEIYVRKLKNGKWSGPVQVSPKDVPDYEDHTDPAIVADSEGVLVAWSWDYHRPKGYPKEPETASIFVRRVVGRPRAKEIRAISGTSVDVTPAVAIDGKGNLQFAWSCLKWDGSKSKAAKAISIAALDIGLKDKDKVEHKGEVAAGMMNVCTPDFASGDGKLTLVWSQRQDGKKWVLKRADFDSEKISWSEAETLESEGNPRFCSADFDSKGALWIAMSVETENGREVKVKRYQMGEELPKE
jgi:hypothetical protein